jgi:hypothetical protein
MNLKRILALGITILVGLSLILIVFPGSIATASGSVSYIPTVFSAGVQTLTVANGGTFGSGSTVYFYISTTKSSSGIIGSYVGSYTLSGGTTTLSNSHFKITIPSSISPGSYYLLASDSSSPSGSSAQFTSPAQITVSSISPTFSISGSQPTQPALVTGSGWDPYSTVYLYLTGGDGTPLFNTYISSLTSSSSGSLSGVFTIPSIASGTYTIVAEETSGTNSGITSDSTITITPYVSVSPYDINGASGTTLTITGYGFPAGAKITGATVNGITITIPTTTASSNGYFSVSGALKSSINSPGPYSLTVSYNSTSYTQQNAIFVSIPNPTNLGFTFSPSTVYPTSQYTATVYDFPSSITVTIFLGGTVLGIINTDANGYGSISGKIPAMPGGSYYPVASGNNLYKASSQVTVSPFYYVVDPNGNLMTSTFGEYMPSGGSYTVVAYGLTPFNIYTFTDAGASSLNYQGSSVISIASGQQVSQFTFMPAQNGTLIFTFKSVYSASSVTFETVSLGISQSTSYGYNPVISPTISLGNQVMTQGKTYSLSLSGLIPKGSNVYPGLNYVYNIYIGSTELSFSTSSALTSASTQITSTTSSTTLYFSIPSSISNGLYNVSIVYNGQGVSSAISSALAVVSSQGTSYSSGSLSVVEFSTSSGLNVYVVGYGYYSTPTLYIMTYLNLYTASVPLTYGGFLYNIPSSYLNEPAGTYSVFTVVTYSSQSYYVYSSYTVTPTISFSQNYGSIYSSIGFTAKGLHPNSYYSLYIGNIYLGSYSSDSYGTINSNFIVPLLKPGIYNVQLYVQGSTSPLLSKSFKVIAASDISVQNYAFPGQLVQFSWTPSTANSPHAPTPTSSPSPGNTYYGSIYVTVYLNNSAYTTINANYASSGGTVYLNGSFVMPNAPVGSYWALSLGWTQAVYTIGTHSANGSTVQSSYIGSSYAFLGLVSGNGALLTGITPDEVAQLEVAINNTLTTIMQVPLSELNAAVSAIQGTSATISTSFGTMETTLNAINASVSKVINNEAYINTTLGGVKTSLLNINASIAGVNGNIVMLRTTAGYINTTLNNLVPEIIKMGNGIITLGTLAGEINYNVSSFSNMQIKAIENNTIMVVGMLNGMNTSLYASLKSINGTVKSTASSVDSLVGSTATIQTDLGTITGQITSVQNGIATIQTSIGELNVTTSQIKVTGSNSANTINISYYFDIIILVLLIVSLTFSVLAYINSRKTPKGPKEWK